MNCDSKPLQLQSFGAGISVLRRQSQQWQGYSDTKAGPCQTNSSHCKATESEVPQPVSLPTVQETLTKQNQELIEWKPFPYPNFILTVCRGQIGKKGKSCPIGISLLWSTPCLILGTTELGCCFASAVTGLVQ